jgi:hypothetical protein
MENVSKQTLIRSLDTSFLLDTIPSFFKIALWTWLLGRQWTQRLTDGIRAETYMFTQELRQIIKGEIWSEQLMESPPW